MKLKINVLLSAAVISTLGLYSCKTQQTAGSTTTGEEFKEIVIPCNDQGRSDATHFRAADVGRSQDMSTSKSKALLNTRTRLSTLIQSTIKSVGEQYTSDMQVGDATEFRNNFETMTRSVVNQTLVDVSVVCEKTGKNAKGEFETYMAIEVSKDAIYNGVKTGIEKEKKLELKYDQMKFKEKFDEEMSKLEQAQY